MFATEQNMRRIATLAVMGLFAAAGFVRAADGDKPAAKGDVKPEAAVEKTDKAPAKDAVKSPEKKPAAEKKSDADAKPAGEKKPGVDKTAGEKKPAVDKSADKKVAKKEAGPAGGAPRGRVEKIVADGETLTVTVGGKDYQLKISDSTMAMIKADQKDGAENVVGIQIFNAAPGGQKKVAQADGPKKTKDPSAKSPEAKKEGAEKANPKIPEKT